MEVLNLPNFLLQLDFESYFHVVGHAFKDVQGSTVLYILRKFLLVMAQLGLQSKFLLAFLV